MASQTLGHCARQVASGDFVQGSSDVKLVDTSLVIKSEERKNLQLHTSQVLSGNNNTIMIVLY